MTATISRTIHVAHSPDADDAFMFWAMAQGKIDTGDRRYVHELGDIESLNRRALAGELEVTAVSLHAYAYLADRYALLAHGASIGDRYGPLIVSRKRPPTRPRAALTGRLVAVPPEAQIRVRCRPSGRGAGARAGVQPRARHRAHLPICRHVRERLHG